MNTKKSIGVINSLDYVEMKYANKSDKRHFMKPNDILISSDNVKFLVSNQWDIENIGNIVRLGRELGFTIDEIK